MSSIPPDDHNPDKIQWDSKPPWPHPSADKSLWDEFCRQFIEVDDVAHSLFHAIEAPGNLQGLFWVMESVVKWLPYVERLVLKDDCSILKDWTDCATDILDKRPIILDYPDYQRLDANDPRGICGSNPFYAVLMMGLEHRHKEETLMTLITAVYVRYRNNWETLSESQRGVIGLSLRSLMDEQVGRVDLDDAIDEDDSFIEMGEALEKVPAQDRNRDYIYTLSRLLMLKFSKGSYLPQRSSHGPKERYGIRGLHRGDMVQVIPQGVGRKTSSSENFKASGIGRLSMYQGSRLTQDDKRLAQDQGIAPDDLDGSEAYAEEESPPDIKPESHFDVSRLRIHAREIAAAIEKENQVLSVQWRQLTGYDLYVFWVEIFKLAEKEVYEDVPGDVLAALLSICFYRGMELADAMRLKFIIKGKARNELHMQLKESRKKGRPWVGEWCISAKPYPMYFRPSKVERVDVLTVTREYLLPIPGHLAHWLGQIKTRLMSTCAGDRQKYINLSGSINHKKIEMAASKWRESVRRRYPASRLTFSRIESYMALRTMQSPNLDGTMAAYLKGRPLPNYFTQLFYTRIATQRLEEAYTKICRDIWAEVNNECRALSMPEIFDSIEPQYSFDGISEPAENGVHVGSVLTPRVSAVKKLSAGLKKRLTDISRRLPVAKRTINYHNNYTAYTVFLMLYSTGYRSVNDPFPDPRLLDAQTGFMAISDKDNEDAYNTRLVWVPDICRKQVGYYKDHIKGLRNRLAQLDDILFEDLTQQLAKWNRVPPPIKKRGRLQRDDSIPFFFFINHQGGWDKISPKVLQNNYQQLHMQARLNGNRHILRSELVKRGCSSVIIDAFMGHWCRGCEPWGRYSTLSPKTISKQIDQYLTPLLKELGWTTRISIEA